MSKIMYRIAGVLGIVVLVLYILGGVSGLVFVEGVMSVIMYSPAHWMIIVAFISSVFAISGLFFDLIDF